MSDTTIGRIEVLNPGTVVLRLTLQMTVDEWKEVAALMPGKWPHWQTRDAITNAIRATVGRIEGVTVNETSHV